MKEYLFLFPDVEYFKYCIDADWGGIQEERCNPYYLNKLINARYRNKGYSIDWLLFSLDSEETKPDLSRITPYIEIQSNDRILFSGVSFEKLTEERAYLDPSIVLNQIPRPDKLIIGGFHQWFCVNKIAKNSYNMGIDTFVDEDTTEMFFPRTLLVGTIPLVRDDWSLRNIGISSHMMEVAKAVRKNKPWFIQE